MLEGQVGRDSCPEIDVGLLPARRVPGKRGPQIRFLFAKPDANFISQLPQKKF